MSKNRLQMITVVADALGKSSKATSMSGALLGDRCIDFLNWGQQRIARAYNFEELNAIQESAALVASTLRYPMKTGTNNLGLTRPKDIASVRLIDSENSRCLDRWSYRKFDKKFPNPSIFTTGRPSIYVRYGNNLEFFRIPDSAYSLYIRYPQWAQDLSSDGQTSDFEDKDQLIITAGILEGYLHFEEYEDAKIWASQYAYQLQEAIKISGDMDWKPSPENFSNGRGGYISGEPWIDPFGTSEDPLSGYAD